MATYYASTAVADGDTTTAGTEGDPCSFRRGVVTLATAAGDILYVRNAGGTWNASDSDISTSSAGTELAPITVEGYTTTPGDGGRPTINFAATRMIAVSASHRVWRNLNVTNGSRAFRHNAACSGSVYDSIVATGQTTASWQTNSGNSNEPITYIRCASINAAIGWDLAGGSGSRNDRLILCAAINSTGDGFRSGAGVYGPTLTRCFAHKCGGDGFELTGYATLINCIANRCTGSGFNIASADVMTLVNCGATDNGAWAVTGVASSGLHTYNCGFNGNTSGTVDTTNVTKLTEIGLVTTAPSYTAGNPGTATDVNLTIAGSSPWAEAGIKLLDVTPTTSPIDIGVLIRAASGGGIFNPFSALVD
jgi:hypothetical protein